jgi:hypothetical protein
VDVIQAVLEIVLADVQTIVIVVVVQLVLEIADRLVTTQILAQLHTLNRGF